MNNVYKIINLKIMKFVNRYKEIQTQLEVNKDTISNFDKEVLEKEIKDIDYNSYKYREQVKNDARNVLKKILCQRIQFKINIIL
jgi:hypothetical protein